MRYSDKKGSVHLEMILSFTVYLTFTVFLLYFLSPIPSSTLSSEVMDVLFSSIFDYAGVEVVSFSVLSNETGCLNLSLLGLEISGNSSVFNSTGKISSKVEGGSILFDVNTKEVVKVYVSNAFSSGSSTCFEGSNVKIGDIYREIVLSNSSLTLLEGNYFSNYSELKDALNLPSLVDFSLSSPDYLFLERNPPSGVKVISERYFVNIAFSDGTIEEREVLLSIW